MRLLSAVAAVALSASATATTVDRPQLDLVEFFTGRTHGEGNLKIAFKKPVRHIVDSVGRRGANGEFILIDRIREGDDPVRERRWAMRPTATGFTGTMTDAVGPVRVSVSDAQATISYRMKGGISINQILTLERDGKTLANHVVGKKLGVRAARLDGHIRKLD